MLHEETIDHAAGCTQSAAEETVNHDQGYNQHLGQDTPQFKSHLTSFLRDPVIRTRPEKGFNLYQKELNVTSII